MPPKKLSEELEELKHLSPDGKLIVAAIKKQITLMERRLEKKYDEELERISNEFSDALKEKDIELQSLKVNLESSISTTTALNKSVKKLAADLDAQDAYNRRESVIISGHKVKPVTESENCPNIVRELVRNELKLQIDPMISTAHRLGKPPAPSSNEPDRRAIIVRFCQKDTKNLVYNAARKLKVNELYVNESLTPVRRKIMAVLRKISKTNNRFVKSCSTFNGNCFVYTLPSLTAPETTRAIKTQVNDWDTLSEICPNFVKKPVEYFL